MSLSLGEKLREAREARGLSISEVAEQTRISRLYLESIENNDYKILPGGIFNKGFVKSYAKFVGIDDQEALQDYSRLLAEQGEPTAEENKTYRPEVLTDDNARSTSLPTLIFAIIILGLLAFGVYYFVNYWQNSQNQPGANNSANANKTANSANANVETAPTPIPAVNEIKLELKAVGNPISVSHATDGGKTINRLVTSAEPLTLTGQQSVKISYYKGFTPDKVQLILNGKQIAAPAPPAKGNIIFEITKDNAAQIMQSGVITVSETAAPAAKPAAR